MNTYEFKMRIYVYSIFLSLIFQCFMPFGCVKTQITKASAKPSTDLAFVGTWVSTVDDSILALTPTTYYHRFRFKDGVRGNYGEILSYDTKLNHIKLKYNRVLQNGKDFTVDDRIHFMTYEINENILRKAIGKYRFPKEVNFYDSYVLKKRSDIGQGDTL